MLRLRTIRQARGLSLRELRRLSGVHLSALTKLEGGGGDPQLSTLKKLAKALQVTVAELIGETKLKKGGA